MSGPIEFDKAAILARFDVAKWSLLNRLGFGTMATARALIRPGQQISPPGQPPSTPTGIYPRLLLYGVDRGTESVVIGPIAKRPGSQVARRLEYGGHVTVNGQVRRYRPRPTMRPAFRAMMQSQLAAELSATTI